MVGRCQILVMASGDGSSFQAVLDAVAHGHIPNSTICHLFVNRGTANATTRAENHGVPWEYFNLISHGFQKKGEKDLEKLQEARDKYDAALAKKVLSSEPQPQLIILAGWMHIFGTKFLVPVSAAGIKVINLHPALPGKYDGMHAVERAFEDFQAGRLQNNKTGITVHNVIMKVDRGEAIMTREVECLPGDDLEKLTERVHSHEHELLVEATAKVVGEILAR